MSGMKVRVAGLDAKNEPSSWTATFDRSWCPTWLHATAEASGLIAKLRDMGWQRFDTVEISVERD